MNTEMFTDANKLETLSGIVKRITFHSLETGWSVLKINPSSNLNAEVTVTIHQSKVFAGATMDFYGNWTHHPKYGDQFKAVKAVERQPASANALEKYLGSGLIKGVGPVFAKRIVDHFGKDTLEVFDTHIERLSEVPGIATKKLEMIAAAWVEHKDIKDVMLFLQEYDISTLFAVKIYKTYGKEAIQVVSENPYKLAQDIYGIGFFSADQVALSMKLDPASEQRIRAAIDHVLDNSREEGHCYLTREQIIKQVNELLTNSLDEQIAVLLEKMEQEGLIKVRAITISPKGQEIASVKGYYAPSIYRDEEYIAKKVKELGKKKVTVDTARVKQWIGKYTKRYSISLSDEQEEAVIGIVKHGFSILTGGPGCGKTTTTRVLVALLKAMDKRVLLAAPTGRASQRMTEVIGEKAKTIHRLLEWQPAAGGFKKNDQDPLQANVLIIDECSMLDVHLAAALLRAVSPITQVLFIGDADQLPSVGAGNIFKDIIASGSVPVFHLTKIFRQAQESSIIRFAHEINKGITPVIESPFHKPAVWQEKLDCLFLDSDEATQEQLHFIKRVKMIAKTNNEEKDGTNNSVKDKTLDKNTETELYTNAYEFTIPDKFQHVDIEKLAQTQTYVDELKEVMKKVHPWSSFNYGLSATDTIKKIYCETIPKYYGRKTEIQILTPMTRGSLGTFNLNKLIQQAINPPQTGKPQLQLGERLFRVGDRVIQKRNNYDLQVFNGDIGKISGVDNEEMKLIVEYKAGSENRVVTYEKESLTEIELAYAITIHKSQGSEFETIIVPITTQHFNMLFRNLLYTGLTRAKKLAIFIGSRKALAMAVRNNKTTVRQTALESLLRK